MKAFLTGVAGFVGTGVARALLARGDEVHGLVRSSTDLWRLEDVKDHIVLHEGNLCDSEAVSEAIKKAAPTHVFHLGAYGAYPGKQTEPRRILETTVLGGLNVFTAAKDAGVQMIVNTGSSSEYGTKDHPMREDESIAPNSYYAVGKAAQTLLAQHMARAGEVPTITLRLFSVYGPFEEKGRLMPTVIGHALAGRDVPIADPRIARDFIYLPDAVRAFLAAAERPQLSGEIVNVGTGVQHTLQDVFDTAVAATKSNSKPLYGTYEKREFDTNTWVADAGKMKTLLGVTPEYSLAAGVEDMVKWFPSYAHNY